MKKWLVLLLCVSLTIPAVCFAEATSCEHQRPTGSSGYMAQDETHAFVCPLCNQTIQEGHTLSDWKYDNAEHWKSCAVCGAEKVGIYLESHYTDCTGDKTSCTACGMVGNNISINHGDYIFQPVESGHLRVCELCGDALGEVEAHCAYCDDLSICRSCKVAYSGSNIQHLGSDRETLRADEASHWYYCDSCNQRFGEGAHYALCTNSTHCAICDALYSGTDIRHIAPGGSYVSGEGYHWHMCGSCNEVIEPKAACFASCTDPTHCVWCKADYSGTDIRHAAEDWTNYVFDAEEHWHKCTSCNAPIGSKMTHLVHCTDPTHCSVCGGECVGNPVIHTDVRWEWKDATTHQKYCYGCNQLVDAGTHYADCFDLTHCAICGADYDGSIVVHDHGSRAEWQFDTNNHWRYCSDCKQNVFYDAHSTTCADPTHCAVCKADFSQAVPNHLGANYDMWLSNAANHWKYCDACQRTEFLGAHYTLCNDPDHCAVCGASFSGNAPGHGGTDWTWKSDESTHWQLCTLCQQKLNERAHSSYCTDPTHCCQCGATYSGNDIMHRGLAAAEMQHDDNTCWQVCSDCGQKVNEFSHFVSCTDKTHCMRCGIESDIEYEHIGTDWDWRSDANSHWQVCSACQERMSESGHLGSCIDRAHCMICGADYSGEAFDHPNLDWDNPQHDDNTCWYYCSDCEQRLYEIEHRALCTDPTRCLRCGIAYTGTDIRHIGADLNAWKTDGTNHWHSCADCNAKLDEAAHEALCTDPTHCAICGADYGGIAKHTAVDLTTLLSDEVSCWNLCTACNGHVNEAAHTMEFVSETKAAGCETAGAHLYRCTRCGHEESRAVAALEHDYRFERKVAPKVGVKGYDLYVCANCRDTEKRNFVAALPEPVPEEPAPEAPETEEPEIALLVENLKTELETVSEAQAPTVIEVKKTESGEGTLVISALTPASKTETPSADGTTPEAEPEEPKPIAVALSTSVLSMCEEKSVTTVEIASDAGGIDVPVAALKEAVGENETCTVSVQTKAELDETEKQAVAAYTLASAACEVKLSKTGTDGAQSDLKDVGASVHIEWKPDMTDKVVAVCVIDGQAVEIAAVLILDADGNPLYWALPYQGAGVYMMALRAQ